GVPSIIWGFDDASFLYRITKTAYDATAQTTTLTLASSPPDCFHFPAAGQAVEVLRSAAALTTTDYIAAPTGIVSALTTPYDNTQKTLTIAGQLPADYVSTATTPQLYLRVWRAQTTVPALPATPSGPALYSVELDGTGVAVTLTSSTGVFHPGDFWRFALRPIKPAVVYPARIAEAPQPPDGPRTWACPLAVLTWKDGNPTVSSCVKPFVSLVELTASMGGCCTVNIGPGDVDDGATLADLLNGCANIGPVTVCLQPGTYTLSEPLAFGPELNGLTLQGCQPGVVLRGPSQPGSEFGLGLIAMQATQAVTIRGLELVTPLVAIQPPAGGFPSLHNATANQALMQAFCSGLQVAVGISANGCTHLTVEDCTFDLPDPGPTNIFGAGIYATGAIEGLAVKGCCFGSANPPATVPFNQLATTQPANNQFGAAPPYQLTFGYLQIPESTSVPQQTAPQILHDATLERSHFEGVTIPALVMARLGSLRIDTNTVRNTYGGFWLVSIAEAAQTLMFDQQNVGDTKLYIPAAGVGIASLRDAIFMIASQLGQLLPTTGPGATPATPSGVAAPTPATPSGVAAPTPAHLTLAREALTAIHARAQATAGVAITGLPEATRAAVGAPAALSSAIVTKAAVAVPLADTGTSVSLRLDICDCQIDAIIADSYSGAGLLVVDLTADLGSAVVHGNRIRSRFPMGESALLSGLGMATISGNIVANEVAKLFPFIISPPQLLTSHSMVLNPAGASALLGMVDPSSAPVSAGVAITGNVFVDPTILPARAPMTPPAPAPMNDWMFLNTEIDYGLVAPPAVSGVNPRGGLASGNTPVNITGSGFTGVTAVTFGVSAAPIASIKFINDTQITAVSPAGAGTVDVTVTTPAGTSGANAADRFTYLAVTGLNPASGPTIGGNTVIITGTSLSGATSVKFGSNSAMSFSVNSSTQITATAPA
ncbi:MAG TPA: IPT/TIG domain-containing protein, partial [Mycobacterium sp.]|nr:IPT/TIG domain-containing protein [Mycobacterium sp.]